MNNKFNTSGGKKTVNRLNNISDGIKQRKKYHAEMHFILNFEQHKLNKLCVLELLVELCLVK